MRALFFTIAALAFICEAQVYRSYISESTISVVLLKRDREVHKTYYEGGNIKSECEYNKDRVDGICKEYYENGILKSRIEFKNGREHGIANFYYDTGVARVKIDFKRGKPQHVVNYDVRGKRIGGDNK